MVSAHKMTLLPFIPIPDLNVTPDSSDAKGYCASCKWTYCGRDLYLDHLKQIHGMTLSRLSNTEQTPTISANIIDYISSFDKTCCIICKIKYISESIYKAHMKEEHGYNEGSSTVDQEKRGVESGSSNNGKSKP
jgi:hypothetical protein